MLSKNNITIADPPSRIIDGMGVLLLVLIMANSDGRCPFLAPAKNILEQAKIIPFKVPIQDIATKAGIKKARGPIA